MGRPVYPARVEGEAQVTRSGFNSLACYYQSMLAGAEAAICSDASNADLFGKDLTDRIVCAPKTVGSTSAGATWDRVAYMGIAPRALLLSQHIDSLAAAGLAVAAVWAGRRICAVDELGDEFLQWIREGDHVTIEPDGTVTVIPQEERQSHV